MLIIWVPPLYTQVYPCYETGIVHNWVSLRPLWLMDVFWQAIASTWLWMLRALQYRHLYPGISLFWEMNNVKLGYLWDLLGHCGMMADGHFLRSHDLNLYLPQYQCVALHCIWVPLLYIRINSRYLPLAISHRSLLLGSVSQIYGTVRHF